MITPDAVRIGDLIYTDTEAFVVEDTDEFPTIRARSEKTKRTKRFSADQLWSPHPGIFHPIP